MKFSTGYFLIGCATFFVWLLMLFLNIGSEEIRMLTLIFGFLLFVKSDTTELKEHNEEPRL